MVFVFINQVLHEVHRITADTAANRSSGMNHKWQHPVGRTSQNNEPHCSGWGSLFTPCSYVRGDLLITSTHNQHVENTTCSENSRDHSPSSAQEAFQGLWSRLPHVHVEMLIKVQGRPFEAVWLEQRGEDRSGGLSVQVECPSSDRTWMKWCWVLNWSALRLASSVTHSTGLSAFVPSTELRVCNVHMGIH